MKNIFKIMKPVFKLIFFCVTLIGFFSINYFYQMYSSEKYAENFEKSIKYSDITGFNETGGTPLFWTKQYNDRTMFFFGEMNNPNPIGNYYSYFKQIHDVEGCNIIAPVLGTQSMTLKLRNRTWSPKEDEREALQIYNSVCAMLPQGHKIILVAKGTGNFAAAVIMAEASKKPDEVIMISPVNADIVNDDAPIKIRLASTGPEWLKYIFPFMNNSSYPSYTEYKDMYPEYNLNSFHEIYKESIYFEDNIISKIKNNNIAVVWGENDPMYKTSGYERVIQKLMDSKNKVKPYKLKNTGYYVLQGEETDKVKEIFRKAVRNY
ncbi:MAG: hypothetical protein JW982_02465 [Spirochaetes bacterium]|nr:hypothetical protein [Spirochaetota bacterium]